MTSKRGSAWRTWREQPDAIDLLCERIINGESLTAIAHSLETGTATVTDWIAARPERSARAKQARYAAAGTYADLALQALKDAPDPFELARAREVASHYRWQASKANPASYGDRTVLAGDPDAPLIVASQAQRDAAVKAAQS